MISEEEANVLLRSNKKVKQGELCLSGDCSSLVVYDDFVNGHVDGQESSPHLNRDTLVGRNFSNGGEEDSAM